MAFVESKDGKVLFKAGKHRDKLLDEVADKDPDYVNWVIRKASDSLVDEIFYKLVDSLAGKAGKK